MGEFNSTVRKIRADDNDQSEKKRVIEKNPGVFKNNTTIKNPENNIHLRPGHYRMKQKARPIPLHLQTKQISEELEKLRKNRTPRKKHIDEDCFVSLIVITVNNQKSMKIASDSRKLNESCVKIRPHMPNIEERLNRISIETTRDRMKKSVI